MEFERQTLDIMEDVGTSDICIGKVSELQDDITIEVNSCQYDSEANLQFDCKCFE